MLFFNFANCRVFRKAHERDEMLHCAPVEYLGLQVNLYIKLCFFYIYLNAHVACSRTPQLQLLCFDKPAMHSSVVICLIYFQLQLISDDFETVEEKDLEFFFSRDKPIMGWDGHPHPNQMRTLLKRLLILTPHQSKGMLRM